MQTNTFYPLAGLVLWPPFNNVATLVKGEIYFNLHLKPTFYVVPVLA